MATTTHSEWDISPNRIGLHAASAGRLVEFVRALLSSQAFLTIHPSNLSGDSSETMAVLEAFDNMLAAFERAPQGSLKNLAMVIDAVLPSLPSTLTQRLIVTIAERDPDALAGMRSAQMILEKVRHGIELQAILDPVRLARIAADLESSVVR